MKREHAAAIAEVTHPRDLDLATLCDSIQDALVAANPDTGRIVLWNRAATAMFGYSAAEALAIHLEAVFPQRVCPAHRAKLDRCRQMGHGTHADAQMVLELPAVRKTGEKISAEVTISSLYNVPSGSPPVLLIIRDVSERKRAEEAHRHCDRTAAALD